MPSTPPLPDPVHSRSMSDEADIGSGEKSPGQKETDAIVRQIPPLPEDDAPASAASPDVKKNEQGQPGSMPAGPP